MCSVFQRQSRRVRFSNRPVGVKRFQPIHHHYSVDVARGLVLLFGIGTKALPAWDSRTRRNNLLGGLTVSVTAGPSELTNSPHPSSRKGHHSTALWSSSILLSHLILNCSHAQTMTSASMHSCCHILHHNNGMIVTLACKKWGAAASNKLNDVVIGDAFRINY